MGLLTSLGLVPAAEVAADLGGEGPGRLRDGDAQTEVHVNNFMSA